MSYIEFVSLKLTIYLHEVAFTYVQNGIVAEVCLPVKWILLVGSCLLNLLIYEVALFWYSRFGIYALPHT